MVVSHRSLHFDSESSVFLVGEKLFKVPRAILSLHSDVFLGMTQLNGADSDEPIHLTDTEEDFEQFWIAMMMPYESCLEETEPSLKDIFRVLLLANKYCATALEKRARILATRMTEPDVISSHLNASLTALHTVEVGLITGLDAMAQSAWSVMMKDFKTRDISTVGEVISFAERTGNLAFISEAYYATMLRGHTVWNSKSSSLTQTRRLKLWSGTVKCTEAGERAIQVCADAISAYTNADYCGKAAMLWIQKKIPPYDVIRRLEIAAAVNNGEPVLKLPNSAYAPAYRNIPLDTFVCAVREQLGREKERVRSYFVLEERSEPETISDLSR